MTQQRTCEFAIRMALGAQRRDALADVLKDGGVLVAIGTVLGRWTVTVRCRGPVAAVVRDGPRRSVVYGSAIALLGMTGIAAC